MDIHICSCMYVYFSRLLTLDGTVYVCGILHGRIKEPTLRYFSYYMCVYYEILCVQVEVTKFEDLEDTQNELKLKTTLWNAQGEWDTYQEEWMAVRIMYRGCIYILFVYSHIHSYVDTYVHTYVRMYV